MSILDLKLYPSHHKESLRSLLVIWQQDIKQFIDIGHLFWSSKSSLYKYALLPVFVYLLSYMQDYINWSLLTLVRTYYKTEQVLIV